MNIIDLKLINAYTILVLADKYILREEDRINTTQLLVPNKYVDEVEIKVAERTVEVLEGTING